MQLKITDKLSSFLIVRRSVFFSMPLVIALWLPLHSGATQTDTLWNQTDPLGRKQGYWKKESPEGTLIYSGYFRNDRPVGEMQRFFNNGKKKADLFYVEGTDEVYATFYYRNGKLAATGKYLDREKDSVWAYYSNYSGSIAYQETYRKGEKHGESLKFYPEGPVSEVLHWKDGVKHGKWEQFFEDSTLRLSATYHEGELNGRYLVWNRNRDILIKGNYVRGKMDGTWIFNDVEGELVNRLEYDHGKILNSNVLEEWVRQHMEEVDEKLGKLPEVTPENFFNRE